MSRAGGPDMLCILCMLVAKKLAPWPYLYLIEKKNYKLSKGGPIGGVFSQRASAAYSAFLCNMLEGVAAKRCSLRRRVLSFRAFFFL